MIRIVGDLILDEYWYGSTTRISPEAPVPIVNLDRKETRLGGVGNVYNNIVSIVPTVDFVTYADSEALKLLDIDKVRMFGTEKIPLKIRVVSEGHYMSRIDDEQYIKQTELEENL